MHIPRMKQIFEALLLLCLTVAVFGCYGGDGTRDIGAGGATTTISGYATKGAISGGTVTAYKMLADGSKGAPVKSTISAADGYYSMLVPASIGPVIVEVRGNAAAKYVSESDGSIKDFPEGSSFKAVVVPSTTSIQTPATISPLTEAAYQLTAKLVRDNPTASLESAANTANHQIAVMHDIGDILSPPGVDQRYQAALTIVDQMVQARVTSTTDQVMAMNQITAMVSLAATSNDTKYAEAIPAAVTALQSSTVVDQKYLAGISDVAGAVASAPPPPTTVTVTPPPSAPEILAISSTPTTVTLSWSQSNAANAMYRVFRNGTYVASTKELQFTDSNSATNVILPSTQYSYTIQAVDQTGKFSAPSAAMLVTTKATPADATKPSQPTGLAYLSIGYNSVDLKWTPSTDDTAVTGYRVYRNGILVATVATASYNDTTLAPTTDYKYSVTAIDAADNESDKSAVLDVKTPATPSDTQAPSAPGNLVATAPVGSGEVRLAWTASSDNVGVTAYVIYRNGVVIASTDALLYADATAVGGTLYSYQVRARDAVGNLSTFTSAAPFTMPAIPQIIVTVDGGLSQGILNLPPKDIFAPAAPANLTATTSAISATTSSVQLSWSPSTDNVAVTGYEVYRNGSKIATVPQAGYTDPSVTSNTTYAYYIKALDAAVNRSPASAQLLVTPNQTTLGVTVSGQLSSGILGLPQMDIAPPTAPAGLTATASAISANTSSVLLAWSASTDNTAVTGYEVYRNGSKVGLTTQLSYNDPSVTSDITYTYYIKALDAAGNKSANSNQVSLTPASVSLTISVSGQLASSIVGN